MVAAIFILPTLLTHNLPLAMVFEAVRTTLVSISTGLSLLVFGFVSTELGDSSAALDHTFLIMLGCLVIAAALIVCVARRTYPRDVTTALASEATTTTSERQLVA